MASSLESVGLDQDGREPADPAAVRDVAAWVSQLVRTLKTSRLYDQANPTVIRFREDLADSLVALLARRGAVQLRVMPRTLSYSGEDLRLTGGDENLAAVLHRDGISLLGFEPGIEAREVDSLVEQILGVTGPSAGEDDLVTLLWSADPPHVVVETVPLEGEADGGVEEGAGESPRLAWPQQGSGTEPPSPSVATPSSRPQFGQQDLGLGFDRSRSDDWTTGEAFTDLERVFDELESAALFEIARLQEETANEFSESVPSRAIRIMQDCFASDLTAADRSELALFLPRVLRETLGLGEWQSATVALKLLRTCEPQWPAEPFFHDLCGSLAITTRRTVSSLDGQDNDGVASFLALAGRFGPPAARWLMHVLAESQAMRVRRPLTRTIAELCADRPDVILPWFSDTRWYVVRNAVHIMGWIGGESLASHLTGPASHPEARVRREVVAALSQISRDGARPILIGMIRTADPESFIAIVQQLALDGHRSVQDVLLELLRDDRFARRSDEERRTLLLALAGRGDAVLPELQAELNAGGWFSRRPEPDRTAIALCVARIGTPAARAVLERGLHSGHKSVRRACQIAMPAGATHDG